MAKKTPKAAAKRRTPAKAAKRPTASKPVKTARIGAASKPRTKGEFYTTIATHTQLSRKQVANVFETMGRILAADLAKGGPGICNVAGLMKVTVVRKPATKARRGINPFTKQEVMFKAKPARNVVKIRPLKTLKSMV